ncbi:DUF3089 domain-containing protein [Qipengyuania sp. DSG2-2]|uniref:DUF3089 domain-containing protein n=1 Tax=Qipengyuania sp. DGS2-2 TaxID=3349631 RepID=UPI0036D3E901
MARKFLYLVAFIAILVIAGGIALSIWSREATELAFVPQGDFVEQDALAQNAYEDPAMWYSRPGIGTDDPARYQPSIAEPEDGAAEAAPPPPSPENPATEASLPPAAPSLEIGETRRAEIVPADEIPDFAVFFVHPTSYIPVNFTDEVNWNAALGDEQAELRARLFLRGLASAFNRADEIWAPKYRQAAVGAFLTDKPEAQKAIDAAYRDVEQAFAYFLESVDDDKPIVLAGHSQGSLHILNLLRQKVAGTAVEARIAAVYAVGWPISVESDLPALPFPACAAAGQSGCISTWNSFADDNDASMALGYYADGLGFNGQPRGDGPILCVNPITGAVNDGAPASANLGTLVPEEDFSSASLIAGAVPARCDDRGLLLIGSPPDMGEAVLPGNNYHVYDIPLFWRNVQEDVVARVNAWSAQSR